MISFDKVLADVKRRYPKKDHEECVDIAHDWCADLVQEIADRYDTDCIEDHMPAEYFTERDHG